MSTTIFEFVKSFVAGRLKARVFSEAYIELWRIERDLNILPLDEPTLSEFLSSVFCAADMYEPEASRQEHELNDEMLLSEVSRLLDKVTGSE